MVDNLDEVRNIEGFPQGNDEDIRALSAPPGYTSYPNPHINIFLQHNSVPYDELTDDYHKEPFVSDVSEGKSDPTYNAHTYHTKVPPNAIIPYIEHYTEPGEIIFDGFCGSGMTGVAAQRIHRRAILSDLSPIATFIASNYNRPIDNRTQLEVHARKVLKDVENECSWMFTTKHNDGTKSKINYIVWSEVYKCPYCNNEVVYWDAAVDVEKGKVVDIFPCPNCNARIKKSEYKKATVTFFDDSLGNRVEQIKQVPVLINYFVGRKRFDKKPDKEDLLLIEKVNQSSIPYWFPTNELPDGDKMSDPRRAGITHVHHFYFRRNLWILASLADKVKNDPYSRNLFSLLTSVLNRNIFKGNRFVVNEHNIKGRINGPLSGTLYIPPLIVEQNGIELITYKLDDVLKMFNSSFAEEGSLISTQSATCLSQIPSNSIDYIFTDPPFGHNLMYSELNFIWEAWLKVFTNNKNEAVINNTQRKELDDYRALMTTSFKEMYRILKPKRWITVEFHNSRASVWNAIQDSLSKAGFVVAQVNILDKQHGTMKQLMSPGTVENDLIINAFKPDKKLETKLISHAGQGQEADFIKHYLDQLPLDASLSRSKEMLYSKYLAYYVQHGYKVLYNSEQFYQCLDLWGLEERDSSWFSDETQANEYEKRKVTTFHKSELQPQAVLFISDEKSARQWIWNYLDQPRTYDEIYTDFLKALQTSEDEIPEVRIILEESFVRTNGHWKRPDQLTKAELDSRRLKRLLDQFAEYLKLARLGQKLKEVRLEAIIAGFTEAYQTGKYQEILIVGRKLDKNLIESNSDIYDFIDIAEAKVNG